MKELFDILLVAGTFDIALASCPYPVPSGYVFYPFKDSLGYDWGPFNSRNIPAIANDCDYDQRCVAFNSNGWLKWYIKPQNEWDTWTNPCLGLYVKKSKDPTNLLTSSPAPSRPRSSTDLTSSAPTSSPGIKAHIIVRLETLLSDAPGGAPNIVSCKIDTFVENCLNNGIEGVSVELKRSDVNLNVASHQLGHIYFKSTHANTAVYTGKGYEESILFNLLYKLRSRGIKTYAWWPTFNDAVLAQFVSVHSAVVRQHQLEMLGEILTHPNMEGWDGVRLDYIRFNYDEDDFSQSACNSYQSLYGADPLTAVASKFDQPWKDFRRDAITTFLQEATTQCLSFDPALDVGGYVLPFPAHPGGFGAFQGKGNDFTQYHSFGFRILPMIYYQDWAGSSNFEAWTKEKMFWSAEYSMDLPQVWPALSITDADWCGDDESCHRRHVRDALLIAAASGKDLVSENYGSRTVEMFYYGSWGKVEWDRLNYALSSANAIVSGTAEPAPPTGCEHFVPCGYSFYQGQNSPGNDLFNSEYRNVPQIAIDCDADPACEGFNSDGETKTSILGLNEWTYWTSDPCLGLYVKGGPATPLGTPSTKLPTLYVKQGEDI